MTFRKRDWNSGVVLISACLTGFRNNISVCEHCSEFQGRKWANSISSCVRLSIDYPSRRACHKVLEIEFPLDSKRAQKSKRITKNILAKIFNNDRFVVGSNFACCAISDKSNVNWSVVVFQIELNTLTAALSADLSASIDRPVVDFADDFLFLCE